MKLENLKINELIQQLDNATAEEKSTKIIEAIQLVVEESQKETVEQYKMMAEDVQANKENAKKYGLRTLTTKEKAFIDKIKEPKQLAGAFPTADQDEMIPTTITNYIFDELKQEHSLLKYVKFTPAGVKKWLLSEVSGVATWGKIDKTIADEITATLDTLDTEAHKLSAFAFIPQGILSLGYEWIERYIREVLLEVNEAGIEKAVISGTGKDMPIGLTKKLSGAVDGVYPERTAIVINDFSVESLGTHFVTLTDGGKRKIGKVLLIVNPADAYTKVAAASTFLNNSGEYKTAFPYAIEVIESVEVTIGQAILYIPFTYTLGINKQGIAYSDQYQFLEDNRVYKVVTYGNGRLVKENQAVLLNISNVKPLQFNVNVVNASEIGIAGA